MGQVRPVDSPGSTFLENFFQNFPSLGLKPPFCARIAPPDKTCRR